MKIIDNIFIWIGKKLGVKNYQSYEFEVIKDVLIVKVPVYRLTITRQQEFLKAVLDELTPYKEDFGVKTIWVSPKRES
jgi:hypothetical protein